MAIPSYTALADALFDPGQPIRSIDGLALRDNPLAITQGASGAPQVWAQALRYVEFTASGTFNVPTDCRLVYVEVWGAGGSGRSGNAAGGQGGGSGSYAAGWVDVSAESTVTVTVGAGGAAATGTTNGNNGGNSSFGSFVIAGGGLGGTTTDVYNGGVADSPVSIPMSIRGSRGVFGSGGNFVGGRGLGGGVGGAPNGDGNRVGDGGRTSVSPSGAGFRGQVRVWY